MFQDKKVQKNLWIIMAAVLLLAIAMIVMQAQILAIVKDLQTFFFQNYMVSNPLPPVQPADIVGANPLPPVMPVDVFSANPLPPVMPIGR